MFTTQEKMKALGRVIEKARRDKRLQTRQLAEYAGVSSSDLNSVESGEKWPSELAWEKICEFVGLPIGMLAQAQRKQPVHTEIAASTKNKEELEVPANVVVLAEHKKRKWQQTSLFERD